MDVNKVTGVKSPDKILYSINLVAFGLVSEGGILAEKYRWLGKNRYDIMGVWMLFTVPDMYMTITIDDKVETTHQKVCVLYAYHTSYWGKGFRASPRAYYDDGLLDIVYLETRNANRGFLTKLFTLLPTGALDAIPANIFVYKQCKKLEIQFDKPELSNVDGEIYPVCEKITVEVVPKVLPLIFPPSQESV